MVCFTPSGGVAAAGTPNTHDFGASLNGLAAQYLAVTNTHATGVLYLKFSVDGTNYTSADFHIKAGVTVTFDGVNVQKVKADASTNGVTYTILGWRE